MFLALYIELASSRLEGEVLIQRDGSTGEFTEAVIAVDGIAVSRNRVCSVACSLGGREPALVSLGQADSRGRCNDDG